MIHQIPSIPTRAKKKNQKKQEKKHVKQAPSNQSKELNFTRYIIGRKTQL